MHHHCFNCSIIETRYDEIIFIFILNDSIQMTDWPQKNTFYIRYSLYSYIVTPAFSGGATSSPNTAYTFFIDRTFFNNCSSRNRGGAFMVSCNSFFFQRSCCSYCYCLEGIYSGWGHSGVAVVTDEGAVDCSVVFKCAYQTDLGGHISFDLEMGTQTFKNLNASSCLSTGEACAYGATKASASFCTFSNQESAGFTLRGAAKQDVTLSHLAFINNPSIGFKVQGSLSQFRSWYPSYRSIVKFWSFELILIVLSNDNNYSNFCLLYIFIFFRRAWEEANPWQRSF